MAGRDEGFSALYRREYPVVLAFVARRGQPWSQAEDLTHETFAVAWKRYDEIPADPDQARGYLLAIARNHLRNHWRSESRRNAFQNLLENEPVPVIGPPDDAVANHHDLAAAWKQLPAKDQEAIALTAWDGLSSEQAGAVLGISAAAYRRRLSRARKTLAQLLETDPSGWFRQAQPPVTQRSEQCLAQ